MALAFVWQSRRVGRSHWSSSRSCKGAAQSVTANARPRLCLHPESASASRVASPPSSVRSGSGSLLASVPRWSARRAHRHDDTPLRGALREPASLSLCRGRPQISSRQAAAGRRSQSSEAARKAGWMAITSTARGSRSTSGSGDAWSRRLTHRVPRGAAHMSPSRARPSASTRAISADTSSSRRAASWSPGATRRG